MLMEALGYLFRAHSQKRRRLGPLAVLHPLRATALLDRSVDEISLVILMSTLFHDILEDIQARDFDIHTWKDMEGQLYDLLDRMPAAAEERLTVNLISLTRVQTESYYQYIGRLLDGLFSTYFAHTSKKTLQQKLDTLYQNKPLMVQASIAFIVIFLSFLNDDSFYIKGFGAEGIIASN
jgi:hypothetical protein